ncbi:MAG: hypothetical protein MHM6MM_006537 [Cercozoa sp. M6MM]
MSRRIVADSVGTPIKKLLISKNMHIMATEYGFSHLYFRMLDAASCELRDSLADKALNIKLWREESGTYEVFDMAENGWSDPMEFGYSLSLLAEMDEEHKKELEKAQRAM